MSRKRNAFHLDVPVERDLRVVMHFDPYIRIPLSHFSEGLDGQDAVLLSSR
jgi:hypothetical protein